MSDALFPRLASPDSQPALQVGDVRLTYAQLASACDAHRARLDRLGVGAGDRVAVFTQSAPSTPVALVANALAGVVSVPINAGVGEKELAHILGDAAPRVAFAADPSALATRPDGVAVHALGEVRTDASRTAEIRAISGAPLLVLYTSGTTGAPKGAVLTDRNVASNLDGLASAWAFTDRDTLVHALPLFHVHGLVLGLFGALRAGAALRWHPRFAPEALGNDFVHGATMLYAVPTMYHRIAEALEREPALRVPFRRARLLVSGSAALPVREHARIESLTGQRVVERYGLTETLINCAVRHDGERRAGFVGPAVDGVRVRLVDDERRPVDAHDDATLGEVAVRGPNVFDGYLNRPDATRAVRDAEGWFYTGDLATIARDGYVRIVGRRSTDLIKTGGFKVGAGEVEAALLEHEGVREAAVVGTADDDLGERIVAFVVPRENARLDAASMIEHVARTLAPHKRPRDVQFVAELPRNAMGKVMKSALRDRS